MKVRNGHFYVFSITAFEDMRILIQGTGDFSGRSFPYEISKSGDKISNFSFQNWFQVLILQYLMTHLIKVIH